MLKLAVISDSHMSSARLQRFAEIAGQEKFDGIIHCGDGMSDAKWLMKKLDIPVRAVSGNCDPHWNSERELRFAYENVRMLALHGDQYGVKYDLSRLSYHAEEENVQVVLFGHTHQPFAGYVGGVMMINPGALKDGRYAQLNIEKGTCVPFLKMF